MRRFTVAVALALIAVRVGWAASHYRSAESRARRYFGMRSVTSLDSTVIERAVLRVVPVGTPEPQVREYLSRTGIGSDGMSSYSPPDAARQAVVRIEFDTASPMVVKRHFAIRLLFDAESRLERVEVKDWLTGL